MKYTFSLNNSDWKFPPDITNHAWSTKENVINLITTVALHSSLNIGDIFHQMAAITSYKKRNMSPAFKYHPY